MDLIEAYQNKLNIILQNTPYEDLNYMSTLFPLVKELLAEFESKGLKFMARSTFTLPVDIYIEAITYKFVTSYASGNQLTLPNECVILMLIRYPYFINILQCGRTYRQYLKYRKSLLDTFETMYPMKTNEMVNHVHELLSTNIEDVYDIRKCTMVAYLHYLVGFRFEKGSVAITADQLPKGDDISYLIVNLTYNLEDLNSIIIYKDNPKIKDKILNVDNIPKYKCIERPANVTKAREPFVSVDTSLHTIEEYKPKVYVILCYNDYPELQKCHFTIAYYGDNGYVDGTFVNNMLQGSLPRSLTDEDVWNCINTTFLKTFSDDPESIDTLHDELRRLSDIVTKAYDDVKRENKSGVYMFEGFIKNVLADERLANILDTEEMPYFKIYLTNCMVIYANNSEDVNIKDMLTTYVLSYIHEDAYDNLTFHK